LSDDITKHRQNRSINWLEVIFLTVPFVLIFLVSFTIYSSLSLTHKASSQVLGITFPTVTEEDVGMPKRLVIPKINVDAEVQNIGIKTNGEMDVPSNETNVGWYELGFRPGERGNAVIAGHINGKNGEVGVFANLNKLRKDDEVLIEDDLGISRIFRVLGSLDVNPGYEDDVFSQSDGIYLNLVTCSGLWDSKRQIYSKRLVVFTEAKFSN
jgi:LPXTG-site transpeptidase (sortase) family protein